MLLVAAKKENSVVSEFLGFVKDKGCDSFEMHRQIAVPEHTEAGNTPGQRALSLCLSVCVCCMFILFSANFNIPGTGARHIDAGMLSRYLEG